MIHVKSNKLILCVLGSKRSRHDSASIGLHAKVYPIPFLTKLSSSSSEHTSILTKLPISVALSIIKFLGFFVFVANQSPRLYVTPKIHTTMLLKYLI